MAKLIESLAISGSQLATGAPNASGKAWAFVIGTTNPATLYADADAVQVLTQPVTLDAAGRATCYIAQAVTLHLETAAGATLADYDVMDTAGVVEVRNLAFTGTLPNGSQGAGGQTDLDTVLTSAGASFGGTDFKYQESAGGTQRTVADWLREVHLSVKDFGAIGDNVHDDTAAIQATVNRCIALGGGTVYFPPGVYVISSAISAISSTGVSFVGAGFVSAIRQVSSSANGITVSGSLGFQIAQLYITATSSSGTAISVAKSQDFAILDVFCDGGFKTCIDLSTGSTFQINFQVARCFLAPANTPGSRALKTAGAAYLSSIADCVLTGGSGSEANLELIGNVSASTFIGVVAIRGNYINWGVLLTAVDTSSVGVVAIHGNAFGNDGTSHKRITVTGTVPRISNVGNNVDGVVANTTVTTTVTPDWSDGRSVRVNCTGVGGITVNIAAPTIAPAARGIQFRFSLVNATAGLVTWTPAATYHLSAALNNAAGNTTELTVEYDLEKAHWVEISRSLNFNAP